MTEVERRLINGYIGDILVADEMNDFNTLYDTALKILELCKPDAEQEVDDWCDSIEARLEKLEKRVQMLNAYQVMIEAESNERRKQGKQVYVRKRRANRAVNRENDSLQDNQGTER